MADESSVDVPAEVTIPDVVKAPAGMNEVQAAAAAPPIPIDGPSPSEQSTPRSTRTASRRRSPTLAPTDARALRRRIDALKDRLTHLPADLPESSQDLAGKLALTLPAIEEEEAYSLLHVVDVAASAVSSTPPNMKMARRILDGVERSLLLRRKIRYLMQGLGLGLLFTVTLTVLVSLFTPASTGFDRVELGLVALAGFIGASVSLAIKIKDYTKLKDLDTRVLRWTAFFKPLIGMMFALFVYMALNSGIVDITIAGTERTFFFVAVAFVAGFSERFAQDVISKVEQTSGRPAPQGAAPGGDGATRPPDNGPAVLASLIEGNEASRTRT